MWLGYRVIAFMGLVPHLLHGTTTPSTSSELSTEKPTEPRSAGTGKVEVLGVPDGGIVLLVNETITLQIATSPAPIAPITLWVAMPPGFTASNSDGDPLKTETAGFESLQISELSTSTELQVTAVGPNPSSTSEIVFGQAISADDWFQGVLPVPDQLQISSIIQGEVMITAPKSIRLFTSKDFEPHTLDIVIEFKKHKGARGLTSGGFLPITLPPGFEQEGQDTSGLQFPALLPNQQESNFVIRIVASGAAQPTPQPIIFGALVSDDPQWSGVIPDTTRIMISSIGLGEITATPGSLDRKSVV